MRKPLLFLTFLIFGICSSLPFALADHRGMTCEERLRARIFTDTLTDLARRCGHVRALSECDIATSTHASDIIQRTTFMNFCQREDLNQSVCGCLGFEFHCNRTNDFYARLCEPPVRVLETQPAETQPTPVCGNGRAEVGEQCGEPGLSCPANSTCHGCQCAPNTPRCGDGMINQPSEECEPAGTATCDTNCKKIVSAAEVKTLDPRNNETVWLEGTGGCSLRR